MTTRCSRAFAATARGGARSSSVLIASFAPPLARISNQWPRSTNAVSTLAAIGLLAAGVAGLGAGSGGLPSISFSNSDSVNSQYCPPTSQSGGKPKDKDEKGGNKCGQPKNKKDDD